MRAERTTPEKPGQPTAARPLIAVLIAGLALMAAHAPRLASTFSSDEARFVHRAFDSVGMTSPESAPPAAPAALSTAVLAAAIHAVGAYERPLRVVWLLLMILAAAVLADAAGASLAAGLAAGAAFFLAGSVADITLLSPENLAILPAALTLGCWRRTGASRPVALLLTAIGAALLGALDPGAAIVLLLPAALIAPMVGGVGGTTAAVLAVASAAAGGLLPRALAAADGRGLAESIHHVVAAAADAAWSARQTADWQAPRGGWLVAIFAAADWVSLLGAGAAILALAAVGWGVARDWRLLPPGIAVFVAAALAWGGAVDSITLDTPMARVAIATMAAWVLVRVVTVLPRAAGWGLAAALAILALLPVVGAAPSAPRHDPRSWLDELRTRARGNEILAVWGTDASLPVVYARLGHDPAMTTVAVAPGSLRTLAPVARAHRATTVVVWPPLSDDRSLPESMPANLTPEVGPATSRPAVQPWPRRYTIQNE